VRARDRTRAQGLPASGQSPHRWQSKTKTSSDSGSVKECQALGLKIGPDDVTDVGNVVGLLEGANEEQGLRYFRTKGSTYPDLAWTRDAVEKLLQAIEPAVEKRRADDGIVPGQPVKFDSTLRQAATESLSAETPCLGALATYLRVESWVNNENPY
jgi:hypothetical protein